MSWINVSDGLPPDGKPVFMADQYFVYNETGYVGGDKFFGWITKRQYKVTHWMELPPKPKQR